MRERVDAPELSTPDTGDCFGERRAARHPPPNGEPPAPQRPHPRLQLGYAGLGGLAREVFLLVPRQSPSAHRVVQ